MSTSQKPADWNVRLFRIEKSHGRNGVYTLFKSTNGSQWWAAHEGSWEECQIIGKAFEEIRYSNVTEWYNKQQEMYGVKPKKKTNKNATARKKTIRHK